MNIKKILFFLYSTYSGLPGRGGEYQRQDTRNVWKPTIIRLISHVWFMNHASRCKSHDTYSSIKHEGVTMRSYTFFTNEINKNFFTAVTYGTWLRISVMKLVWDVRKKKDLQTKYTKNTHSTSWSWPFPSTWRRGYEWVEPNLYFSNAPSMRGKVNIPIFYSRSQLQAQKLLLEELRNLGCDAVYIGKQLTDVSKDSYTFIFRVKKPTS
jgi:hypothetical protein